jgi:hypothetical protein
MRESPSTSSSPKNRTVNINKIELEIVSALLAHIKDSAKRGLNSGETYALVNAHRAFLDSIEVRKRITRRPWYRRIFCRS